MILHGLLQKARLDANTLGYVAKASSKGWTVWRMTPVGWKWNADFGDRDDAQDYLVSKMSQEDR